MRVLTVYEGQEILVEEEIKLCLDKLEREKKAQKKKIKRHELLWDSMRIEELDSDEEVNSAENDAILAINSKHLRKILDELGELDRELIIDRYVNRMKLPEMEKKYLIPETTLSSRIKRILDDLKYNLKNYFKKN